MARQTDGFAARLTFSARYADMERAAGSLRIGASAALDAGDEELGLWLMGAAAGISSLLESVRLDGRAELLGLVAEDFARRTGLRVNAPGKERASTGDEPTLAKRETAEGSSEGSIARCANHERG